MIDLAQALATPRRMAGTALPCSATAAATVRSPATWRGRRASSPALSDELSARIWPRAAATAATRNPVDLAGGGEQDFNSLLAHRPRAARVRRGRRGADDRLLRRLQPVLGRVQGRRGQGRPDIGRPSTRPAGRSSRRPCTTRRRPRAQREGGIPVYPTIEAAVAATAALVETSLAAGCAADAAAPVGGRWTTATTARGSCSRPAGVPFVEARRCRTTDEGWPAGRELSYPVVLKALGILHKSDAGGVKVGIADDEALAAAVADMQARLAPPEFSVERMAPLSDHGVELIVGTKPRSAVRPGGADRPRRHLRRGVQGQRGRAGAARRRGRRAACWRSSATPAASGDPRPARRSTCGRRRRRRRRCRSWPRRGPTSPRSRSTRCW